MRNLLLVLLGIIDWVFIVGDTRRRLGDRAAYTIVVKIDRTQDAGPLDADEV